MSLIRMLGIYLLDSNVHCVICLINIVQWINQIKLESFFIPRGIHSNIKYRLTRKRLIAINWFLFCSFVEVSLIHYAAKMQHFSQMFFSFSLTSPCATDAETDAANCDTCEFFSFRTISSYSIFSNSMGMCWTNATPTELLPTEHKSNWTKWFRAKDCLKTKRIIASAIHKNNFSCLKHFSERNRREVVSA